MSNINDLFKKTDPKIVDIEKIYILLLLILILFGAK